MPKYSRYVSDGASLYGVMDMPKLLSIRKVDLMEIYVNTKYSYSFECAIKAALEMGILEQEDPNEEYSYPFDEIRATLEDFVKSGIFTDDDLAFLEERVLDKLGADPDKINENPI